MYFLKNNQKVNEEKLFRITSLLKFVNFKKGNKSVEVAWRTLANQEVILWIGPLGKLGHFE